MPGHAVVWTQTYTAMMKMTMNLYRHLPGRAEALAAVLLQWEFGCGANPHSTASQQAWAGPPWQALA